MRTSVETITLLDSGPSDLNLAIRAEFLFENHTFLIQFPSMLWSKCWTNVDDEDVLTHTLLARFGHWNLHINNSFFKFHEFICIKLPRRPFSSLIVSRLGICPCSGQQSAADWLTRANIGTGTWPPPSTWRLLKPTAWSARDIALKFYYQFSTRFRDRVNVSLPPSLLSFRYRLLDSIFKRFSGFLT
jgi:hypothetical protein